MTANDVLAWLGGVGTVIGIPLTFVLARRSRQRPDLRAAVDFDVIVDSDDGILQRLSVEFDQRPILSLSRTIVAFWNERGDTVIGSDILDTDKLRVQLHKEDTALHARILSSSRQQIGASCALDPNDPTKVDVHFDFLDAKDGMILEVLHVRPEKPDVAGTIRGAVVNGKKHRWWSRVDLSRKALDAMAEPSALRRPFKYTKPAVFLGFLFQMIMVTILAIATAIQGYKAVFVKPHLVDPKNYDLTTGEGQHAFAQAIKDAGNFDSPGPGLVIATLALAIVALAMVVWSLWRSATPSVPRSLVKEQTE